MHGATIKIINPLNAKLNPICHLLALLGGATIVVVSRLRVNVRDFLLFSDITIFKLSAIWSNFSSRVWCLHLVKNQIIAHRTRKDEPDGLPMTTTTASLRKKTNLEKEHNKHYIQVHILPKHPHSTKPTHTHTHMLQNKIKQPQYKLHTKWNSHNTIKYPQYKVTLMWMVLLSPKTSP